MDDLRVLITGADTEIGAQLMRMLDERGISVCTLSGDVADESVRGQVVGCGVLVHLAEAKGGNAHINILGTINMLHAAKEAGAKRFVFASSTAAADHGSMYGVAKRAGELYGDSYRVVHGLEFIVVRLPEVTGAPAAAQMLFDAIV